MSAMVAMAPCYACGTVFQFNPNKVPSVRDSNNRRQALCLGCIIEVNKIRRQEGLHEVRVLPGAYEAEIIE